MPHIEFTVPGDPRAWKRARTNKGRHFTETGSELFMGKIATIAHEKMKAQGLSPFTGPVRIRLEVYYSPLKSVPKSKRGFLLAKATKPDFDNLAKIIGDALNGIVWIDDAQIFNAEIFKWHAAEGDGARVVICAATTDDFGAYRDA